MVGSFRGSHGPVGDQQRHIIAAGTFGHGAQQAVQVGSRTVESAAAFLIVGRAGTERGFRPFYEQRQLFR
ncbi:MAG: hypothetical protein ACRDTT_23895 [Pseudonocardiaceae bacterium]